MIVIIILLLIIHQLRIVRIIEAVNMNTNDQETTENHPEIEMRNTNVIHESNSFSNSLMIIADIFSCRRNHRDESDRHRSSHRTPTRTNPNSSESSQAFNDQSEPVSELNPSHRDDSERSSSRHSHQKNPPNDLDMIVVMNEAAAVITIDVQKIDRLIPKENRPNLHLISKNQATAKEYFFCFSIVYILFFISLFSRDSRQ